MIRSGVDSGTLAPSIRTAVASAFGVFAMRSLVLAAGGIFGVAAQAVNQQQRAIALRSALGARPGRVLSSVLGGVAWMILAGIAIGAPAAWAAGRIMTSLVEESAVVNPAILAAACVVFLAVAGLACVVPASRALRIDPAEMLKEGG